MSVIVPALRFPVQVVVPDTEKLPELSVCATIPSAASGKVRTLLLLEDEGACKLKDPPPEAAFSLIFAVLV